MTADQKTNLVNLILSFYDTLKEMATTHQIIKAGNVEKSAETTLQALRILGFKSENYTSKIIKNDEEAANRLIELDRNIETLLIEA